MSAKFELEAMRIALGEMLDRVDRIEKEICGECREAAPGGLDGSKNLSTVCVQPSGAAVIDIEEVDSTAYHNARLGVDGVVGMTTMTSGTFGEVVRYFLRKIK